jgi:hypothetical protein
MKSRADRQIKPRRFRLEFDPVYIEPLERRLLMSAFPTRIASPYVDATAYPAYDLVGNSESSGNKYYTLAFVVSDTSNPDMPAWGGYDSYSVASGYFASQIAGLRAIGGDVTISFGGEAGTELAEAITNVSTLEAAYQSVVTEYNVTRLDFDIEGAAVDDAPSILRRSEAIASLESIEAAAGTPIQVWYTLPVLPTGLTSDGVNVVQSAISNGVTLTGVNVMAMDYGDSAAPDPNKTLMGTYAIDAATATEGQLATVYSAANIPKTTAQLWHMIGVTPMIGVNDVETEVFSPAEAQQLVTFAQQYNLGELAFWSANRDQPGDSGITQTADEFTGIFETFDGANIPSLSVSPVTVNEPAFATTTTVAFTVTLSSAATDVVTCHYETTDGTAIAGTNYVPTLGKMTILPGQLSKTISVTVDGANMTAASEAFSLKLLGVTNASISTTAATATIIEYNTPITFTVAGVTVNAVKGSTVNAVFTVRLPRAVHPGETVSVHYATANGTAIAGTDYTAATGILTFSTGTESQTISVPVMADPNATSNKTFTLALTSPTGGTIATASATASIVEPIAVGSVAWADTSDWGSGFNGQITITNTSTSTWSNWTLQFTSTAVISSVWDAVILSQVGDVYTIGNASWNGSVAPGDSVDFGYGAAPGGVSGPTSYLLNGLPATLG